MIHAIRVEYDDGRAEVVPLVVGPFRRWARSVGLGDVDEWDFDDETDRLVDPVVPGATVTLVDE